MDFSHSKNLITTKEAGASSGYTADYIARLIRSGKIEGKKVGHNWFVNKESLDSFLVGQEKRDTGMPGEVTLNMTPKEKTLPGPWHTEGQGAVQVLVSSGGGEYGSGSFFSHAIAAGTAFLIIAIGAAIADTRVLTQVAGQVSSLAAEAAQGFSLAFEPILTRTIAQARASNNVTRIETTRSLRSAVAGALESLPLARIEIPAIGTAMAKEYDASYSFVARAVPTALPPHTNATVADPSRLIAAAGAAYTTLGDSAYRRITQALGAYYAFVQSAGADALSVGVSVRDVFNKTSTAAATVVAGIAAQKI